MPRKTITLADAKSVREFARNSVVPLHIDGRQNVDREMYSLSRYLLARVGRLSFPISAIHALPGESPDFVLEANGKLVGVEITEASTSEFHDQLVISELEGEYLDHLAPGWPGDTPLITNASLVVSFIRDKAQSLAGGKWRSADYHELLIYCENAPGPGVENSDLIPHVRNQLAAVREPHVSGFRRISLIARGELIFDILGDCERLKIPEV